MTLAKQVGDNCAEARRQTGLSQYELATRVSMHPNELSRLECGRNCPRLTTLLRVARGLGIPLADLLDGIR